MSETTAPQAAATTAVAAREVHAVVIDTGDFSALMDSGKFGQLQRVGTMYANSKMVPAHFQGDAPSCMIGVQMAMRLGVDPFMFLQKTFVVAGKPGMEAQLAIALVNTRGPFDGPIDWNFERDDKGNVISATAFATNAKTKRVCQATVDWKLVQAEGWDKKGGSKWNTMREQMFAYRSAVFLARRYCPEVLMGMSMAEELEEIDVTPQPAAQQANSAPRPGLRERVVGAAPAREEVVVEPDPATGAAPVFQRETQAAPPRPPAGEPYPHPAGSESVDRETGEITRETPSQAAQEPAGGAQPASGGLAPPIPYRDVLGMAKRATTADQAETILDTMRTGYATAEVSEVRHTLADKGLVKRK